MRIDSYTLHTRIYPAAICAVPLILLIVTFEDEQLSQVFQRIAAIEVLGKISVGVASFFLLMQLSRFIGKDVFERKLFRDQLYFPTTDYLLPGDTELSQEFKQNLAARIEADFNLTVPIAREVAEDEVAARRRLRDIVARIRAAAGRAPLVLQRNWEYGFVRNLIGGSAIAVPASIVGALAYRGNVLGDAFVILALAYTAVLAFSGLLLRRHARHYAHQLLYAYAGDSR